MRSAVAFGVLLPALLPGCFTHVDDGAVPAYDVEAPAYGWWGDGARVVVTGRPGSMLSWAIDDVDQGDFQIPPEGRIDVPVPLLDLRPVVVRIGSTTLTIEARVPITHHVAPIEGPGVPAVKRPSGVAVPAAHEVREEIRHGTTLRVTYDPEMPGTIGREATYTHDAMTALIVDAFEHHFHVFGGFPSDTMTWSFFAPGAPCEPLVSPTWYRVCGDALTPSSADDWIVHEMFHAWNQGIFHHGGDGPGVLQAESWLAEGVTVYYTARAQAKADDLSGYQRMMDHARATYASYEGGPLDLPFAELAARTAPEAPGGPPAPGPHTELIYLKGALLAHFFDTMLGMLGHDLDELMVWLYNDGEGRAGYTNDDIEQALGEITGGDWGPWFDAYVHGTDPPVAMDSFVDHATPRVVTIF